MLGSTVLDIGIGLALIYLLLSLICSTINEGISNFLGLRASTLKEGLENLLGSKLAGDIYNHHLVKGLVQKDALPWKRRPSYIPTRTFVLAALNTLNGDNFPTTVDEVRAAVKNIQEPDVRKALLALIDDANGNFEKVKKNLGVWFDHSMDRVSGWYRRKIQIFVLVIAILISFVLGIDTIALAKFLRSDSAMRESLVAVAKEAVENPKIVALSTDKNTPSSPPANSAGEDSSEGSKDLSGGAEKVGTNNGATANSEASGNGGGTDAAKNLKKAAEDLETLQTQFSKLDIPRYPWYEESQQGFGDWLSSHFLGFLITSVALSLGAPFWFDLLNKLVSLRSTGQKPVPEAAVIQAQAQS